MTPRQQSRQTGVFSVPLERIVDLKHPLCVLAGKIDWREFDVAFGSLYDPGNGRPGTPTRPSWFAELVELVKRPRAQKRDDKNKIYSIHAPEVERLSKGKDRKKWEFGCKASVAASSRDNFALGIHAVHGSPYDGHTLTGAIEQVERLSGRKVGEAFADKGYRGHDYTGSAVVHVAKRGMKKLGASLRKWMRRRAAIEPVIGYIKNDGWLGRNWLKGAEGDRMNAILSGCGYNMRKLLRWLLFFSFFARSAMYQALRIGEQLDAPLNVAA